MVDTSMRTMMIDWWRHISNRHRLWKSTELSENVDTHWRPLLRVILGTHTDWAATV